MAGGCSNVAAFSHEGEVLSGCLGACNAVAPATRTAQMRSILSHGQLSNRKPARATLTRALLAACNTLANSRQLFEQRLPKQAQ